VLRKETLVHTNTPTTNSTSGGGLGLPGRALCRTREARLRSSGSRGGGRRSTLLGSGCHRVGAKYSAESVNIGVSRLDCQLRTSIPADHTRAVYWPFPWLFLRFTASRKCRYRPPTQTQLFDPGRSYEIHAFGCIVAIPAPYGLRVGIRAA
jgi:hypothetical protein